MKFNNRPGIWRQTYRINKRRGLYSTVTTATLEDLKQQKHLPKSFQKVFQISKSKCTIVTFILTFSSRVLKGGWSAWKNQYKADPRLIILDSHTEESDEDEEQKAMINNQQAI